MATNFKMTRGDTRRILFKAEQFDGDDWKVIDLTGAALFFTAKRSTDDADGAAVIALALGSGIVLNDAPNGEGEVTIPPAATDSLTGPFPLALEYDLQAKLAGGQIYTIERGRLTIEADVTRRTT